MNITNYVTSKVAVTLLFLLSVPLGYASSAPAPGACPAQNCTFKNRTGTMPALRHHFAQKHLKKQQHPYVCSKCEKRFSSLRRIENHTKKEHSEVEDGCWWRDEAAWSLIAEKISRLREKIQKEHTLQALGLCTNPVRPSTVAEEGPRPNRQPRISVDEADGVYFKCGFCSAICTSEKRAGAHARAMHRCTDSKRSGAYWTKVKKNGCRSTPLLSDKEWLQKNRNPAAKPFGCLLCPPTIPGFESVQEKNMHVREVHGYDTENEEREYERQILWFLQHMYGKTRIVVSDDSSSSLSSLELRNWA